MSRSRYTRWSDSALLFVVKSRDEGVPIKRIAAYVGRGEPAVIEALRRYDAEQLPPNGPDPALVPPQLRGMVGETTEERDDGIGSFEP